MLNHILHVSHYVPKKSKYLGKLAPDYEISTTWVLKEDNDELVKDIKDFCNDYDLIVERSSPCHLTVTGPSKGFSEALLTKIRSYQDGEKVYHTPSEIKIPAAWADKVVHIFGLDNSPIAHQYSILRDDVKNKTRDIAPRMLPTYTPPQLAALYNFPSGSGAGQTVGIIELGGGFILSDITTYLSNLGITTTPNVVAVGVNGATNNPSDTSGASVEVVLDIDIIVAIVPAAAIRVYFGPNSDLGFYNAINRAINDNCSAISISWGAAEVNWTSGSLSAYNTLFQTAASRNVTVTAAAGDNGSSDGSPGLNVDFPASSPYVIACGGTRLIGSGTTITSEVVWNNSSTTSATGGGISAIFAAPAYQNTYVSYALGGQRGLPDVAANADPNTGYICYSAALGGSFVVGGTSAVSPLLAALTIRMNQTLTAASQNVAGFMHNTIYQNASAICRDTTSGNNGAYVASTGWDPCTGHGSINGNSLLTVLMGSTPPPNTSFTASVTSGITPLTITFTNTSTNATSYSWNFGDSTALSTIISPSHQFLNSVTGTTAQFNVVLTATNSAGSTTANRLVSITNPVNANPPVVGFSATPLTGNTPLSVTFNNTTLNGTSYLWNFGNGVTSTLQNPTQSFVNTTAGTTRTFTVSLIATNDRGSSTLIRSNYIHSVSGMETLPVAKFIGTPLTGKAPKSVTFTDQSTGNPANWVWNLGDGTVVTTQNVTHKYKKKGNYTVTLQVFNAKGNSKVTKKKYVKFT